jgi:hypothetical protein
MTFLSLIIRFAPTDGFWCVVTVPGHSHTLVLLRGPFQKFCTLYVFSLKMNFFYFNVISIVLYHSGPTFGQVFSSCLDAFVVDASHYSGRLIRHLLNASEAFPTEWFLQFWEQVKVWWAHAFASSSLRDLMTVSVDCSYKFVTLTCSQNWRNHSVWNASEALRRCLMRWPE